MFLWHLQGILTRKRVEPGLSRPGPLEQEAGIAHLRSTTTYSTEELILYFANFILLRRMDDSMEPGFCDFTLAGSAFRQWRKSLQSGVEGRLFS